MSTRPLSIKYPGLTRRQADFAREFVMNGGRRKDAAVAAGYAVAACHVEANRLLRNPTVLDAVRREAERALHANVALGQHVLAELAEKAESETVRLQAAQALLDRGGLQLIKRTETTVVVEDNRTDAELMEHARRLSRNLGMATIDGADLIRPIRALEVSQTSTPTPGFQAPRDSTRGQLSAAKNSEGSQLRTDIFD